VPVIVGMVLYYATFHMLDDDAAIVELLIPLIGIVIPLVLIYFRKLFVLSIIIFCAVVIIITLAICLSFNDNAAFLPAISGSLAMVASFILVLVYPWEEELKKLTGILAAVIPVVALGLFNVYRLTGSFFEFQNNAQGTLIVTGYSGKKEVIIPTTHKGISVTEIGDKAFYGKNIISVTISDGVTSIGNSAFEGCANLASVTIPDSITNIGDQAFVKCNSLTNVTLPNNVNSDANYSIVDGIWYNEAKTEFIFRPNLIKGISGNVTIPNGITRIGENAFAELTDLTGITIPNSVNGIGVYAFQNCTGLTSVTIGNSVTNIAQLAFVGCNSLTSVIIPKSVNKIGRLAFSGCTSLTSVTFESKSVELEDNSGKAFVGDLHDKYLAGGIGTYTTTAPVSRNSVWTKKR